MEKQVRDNRYRLLIVEDDILTLKLHQKILLEGGYHISTATHLEEARTLIQTNTFDLVILDLHLDDKSGFDLMPLLHDTPVIFVSGRGTMTTAIEAMKAGAYDYIIKDPDNSYLEILPLTVSKTLKQHKDSQNLIATEQQYKDLFENSNDLIHSINTDGHFIYVNPAWKHNLQYTDEEIEKLHFLDIIHPINKKHCESLFDRLLKGNPAAKNEKLVLIGKPGNEIIVQANIYCHVVDKRPLAVRAVMRDITAEHLAHEKLHANQRVFTLAIEAANTGIADFDLKKNTLYIAPKLKQLIGYQDSEVPNTVTSWLSHLNKEDRHRLLRDITRSVKNGEEKFDGQYRMLHKNGSIRWFLTRAVIIRNEENEMVRILGAATDITDQKNIEEELMASREALTHMNNHLEEMVKERTTGLLKANNDLESEVAKRQQIQMALKESEEDYRGLFEKSHDPTLILDPKTLQILRVNSKATEVYGYSKSEFNELNYANLQARDFTQKLPTDHIRSRTKETVEATHHRKDGSTMAVEISASTINYRGKPSILIISRDISDRKKIQSEFNRIRRVRISSIIEGQEIEKRRVSKDLHDSLGQLLTAAKLYLIQAEKHASEEKLNTLLTDTSEILEETLQEVRRISHDLMPSVLQDFGLQAAIEKMVNHMSSTSGVIIDYSFINLKNRLPRDIEVALYRLIQESVNNALKHANPEHIEIKLKKVDGTLDMIVRDNGTGFNLEEFWTSKQRLSKGLYNMTERVEALGGLIDMQSDEQKGTEVHVKINLDTHEN